MEIREGFFSILLVAKFAEKYQDARRDTTQIEFRLYDLDIYAAPSSLM
jgi:hypothetical protein